MREPVVSLSCYRFRKEYPEGDLQHLKNCPSCQEWVKEIEKIESYLRSLPTPSPPLPKEVGFLEIERKCTRTPKRTFSPGKRSVEGFPLPLRIAFALLLYGLTYFLSLSFSPPPSSTSFLEEENWELLRNLEEISLLEEEG